MEKIIDFMYQEKIFASICVAIIGILIYWIIDKAISKIINSNRKEKNKKQKTYIRLFKNMLKYIMFLIIVVIVLQINGINVTSVIAGLGLFSVIAGLALQDALKDIIMGFNIIIDEYFAVGDVLKIEDIEGKVMQLGLKATKLKDINNDNLYTIANRNISQALIKSKMLDIDIPLSYGENIEKVEKIIDEIIEQIKVMPNIASAYYKGVNEFGDSAIYYKIRIYCKPELHPQIKRDVNRLIKLKLDQNNISIPFTQIDIHNV